MNLLFRDDCGSGCTIPLSGGDTGTTETLVAMQEFVLDAMADPRMQTLASALATQVPRGDRLGQLYRVHHWLRERTTFKGDPWKLEHLRHPVRALGEMVAMPAKRTAMDCDDVAMLGAALVGLMGFKPKFIVTGRNPSGAFEHVFYGAQVGRQVIPFDPQEGTPPGQWPVTAKRRAMMDALPPT